ncbi:hypothetical protein HY440_02815 [Candidatus Microgenomates bacterium]|nr:hypothetical protein [Candidatus Microgenomates bacterium]
MAILYIVFVVLTAAIPLRSVLLGGIPFWYDPGRDFLMAWDSLSKLTLIGPPGGVPGIFYGPYWIWLLSLPMIFTRDPRLVTLLAITLPSLVLFPLFLWKLRSQFGKAVPFILWALFIVNFDSYLTFPWSPYLAALLFLALSYLIATKKSVFLIGIVAALTQNFNFAFGVTVILATAVYQLLTNFRRFPRFLLGVILVYLPVILFELRHNFLQTRAFVDTFLKSALYNSAVVGVVGIPKDELATRLISVPAGIFHLPVTTFTAISVVLLLFAFSASLWKNHLAKFLTVCLASLLFTYWATKNPIWPYHFIGVETIFLLLLGLLIGKSKGLTIITAFFTLWLLGGAMLNFFQPLTPDYLTLPTLASKEAIVHDVIADAGQKSFNIFVYSPAIYTFDYDYLFRWQGIKTDPASPIVYLVIPPTSDGIRLDFIQYKTPREAFHSVWEKTAPDGTVIVKRSKTG